MNLLAPDIKVVFCCLFVVFFVLFFFFAFLTFYFSVFVMTSQNVVGTHY